MGLKATVLDRTVNLWILHVSAFPPYLSFFYLYNTLYRFQFSLPLAPRGDLNALQLKFCHILPLMSYLIQYDKNQIIFISHCAWTWRKFSDKENILLVLKEPTE